MLIEFIFVKKSTTPYQFIIIFAQIPLHALIIRVNTLNYHMKFENIQMHMDGQWDVCVSASMPYISN